MQLDPQQNNSNSLMKTGKEWGDLQELSLNIWIGRSGTRSILVPEMALDRYLQFGHVRGVYFTNLKLMFDDVGKNEI